MLCPERNAGWGGGYPELKEGRAGSYLVPRVDGVPVLYTRHLFHPSPRSCSVQGGVPTFQMWEQRLREVKWLIWSHTARGRRCRGQGPSAGCAQDAGLHADTQRRRWAAPRGAPRAPRGAERRAWLTGSRQEAQALPQSPSMFMRAVLVPSFRTESGHSLRTLLQSAPHPGSQHRTPGLVDEGDRLPSGVALRAHVSRLQPHCPVPKPRGTRGS